MPIDNLLQTISHPIIAVAGSHGGTGHGLQAIGGIVCVCVHTIIEQVAVIVPGIGHAVDAG